MVRDLLSARRLIEKRGFAQYTPEDAAGAFCMRGAVNFAIAKIADPVEAREIAAREKWSEARKQELCSRSVLADDCLAAVTGCDNVANWNNEPTRTKSEVLSAFDAAASLALGETAAHGDVAP